MYDFINTLAFTIGFWATVGIMSALAGCLAFLAILTKIVNYVWDYVFPKEIDVTPYLFKELPANYKSMNLIYSNGSLLCSARFCDGSSIRNEWLKTVAVDKDHLEGACASIQLDLMAKIHKDISNAKANQNK